MFLNELKVREKKLMQLLIADLLQAAPTCASFNSLVTFLRNVWQQKKTLKLG